MRWFEAAPIAPGQAAAPARALDRAAIAQLRDASPLDPLLLSLPPDGRAHLADLHGALTAAATAPQPRPAPFIALVTTLDAADAVVLTSRGCVGVLVPHPDAVSEHARHVCVAMGRPVAAVADAPARWADGAPLVLEVGPLTARVASSHRAPVSAPLGQRSAPHVDWPGATLVLPISQLAGQALDDAVEVELVAGQSEEVAIALAALAGRPAHLGVGLLRLEHLLALDPTMDGPTLSERTDAWLTAFAPRPIAIRLTDFGPDKPCPPRSPLARHAGSRGLADLLRTATLDPQLEALAAGARGRPLRVIAPFVETVEAVETFAASTRALGLLPCAMVESPSGLQLAAHLAPHVEGLWLGGRDLAASLGPDWPAEARQALLGLTAPLWVCNPGSRP